MQHFVRHYCFCCSCSQIVSETKYHRLNLYCYLWPTPTSSQPSCSATHPQMDFQRLDKAVPYSTSEDVCACRRFCNRYSTLPICFLVFSIKNVGGNRWWSVGDSSSSIFATTCPKKFEFYQLPCLPFYHAYMMQNMHFITHSGFFIVYIVAASLGKHFLPVRHGLVKERQAVSYVPTPMPEAKGPRVPNFQPYHGQNGTSYLNLSR